jgi:hypothetical protein
MIVDDGTGVILCNKWNNNNPATDLFEVGDFVVIRGRIHYYQQREVTVYRMSTSLLLMALSIERDRIFKLLSKNFECGL